MARAMETAWMPQGESGDTLRILLEHFTEPTTGNKWWIPYLDEPTRLHLVPKRDNTLTGGRDVGRIYDEASRIGKRGRFAPKD